MIRFRTTRDFSMVRAGVLSVLLVAAHFVGSVEGLGETQLVEVDHRSFPHGKVGGYCVLLEGGARTGLECHSVIKAAATQNGVIMHRSFRAWTF